MPDLWMDVDVALAEVPVNLYPLTDDTDFKTRETAIAYNATGMDLVWNFVTPAGAMTQTAVTPTTGGNYDWAHQGDGMYSIEIPASGGASINNDTEGFGWFTGYCTGVLPWRGPVIGFRRAALNDLLIEGGTASTNLEDMFDGTGYAGGATKLAVDTVAISGDSTAADNLETACDGGSYNVGGGGVVAASVTAPVTASTVTDKTGYALHSDYDAAKTAASAASVSAIATILSGITSLAAWLRGLARKDTMNATAKAELNSGGGTYNEATDSLEGSVDSGGSGLTAAQVWAYSTRTLTQSAAQIAAVVAGSTLTVQRGDSLSASITGLGSIAGRKKLWWTVKGDTASADSAALIMIEETAGLMYLNGAAGTAIQGDITVDDEDAGDITITLAAASTAALPPGSYSYDVQWATATGAIHTLTSGNVQVVADVTRTTTST